MRQSHLLPRQLQLSVIFKRFPRRYNIYDVHVLFLFTIVVNSSKVGSVCRSPYITPLFFFFFFTLEKKFIQYKE